MSRKLETQRTDLETALRELEKADRRHRPGDPLDVRADVAATASGFEELAAQLFPGGSGPAAAGQRAPPVRRA